MSSAMKKGDKGTLWWNEQVQECVGRRCFGKRKRDVQGNAVRGEGGGDKGQTKGR